MWENGQLAAGRWQVATAIYAIYHPPPQHCQPIDLHHPISPPSLLSITACRFSNRRESHKVSSMLIVCLSTSFDRRAYWPIRKEDACSNVGIFNASQHVTTHLLTLCARMISHRSGGLNLQPWKEEQPRGRFSV